MVGMVTVPGVAKISVSISPEELAWAKKRARAATTSLAAVVSEALRRQRQAEARLALLADLGTEDISHDDISAMRAEIRDPSGRSARTRTATRKKRRG